jgi:hypothetical protein
MVLQGELEKHQHWARRDTVNPQNPTDSHQPQQQQPNPSKTKPQQHSKPGITDISLTALREKMVSEGTKTMSQKLPSLILEENVE